MNHPQPYFTGQTSTTSQPAQPHAGHRRAALWVWVTGGVLVLLMGCCVTTLTVAAITPIDELTKAAGTSVPQAQLDHFQQIQPLLVPLTIGVFAVGFLPALIYLFTGFGVRVGGPASIKFTRLLMLVQLVLLALLMLLNVVGLVIQRDIIGLVFSAILYLPVLWLLFTTSQKLGQLRTTGLMSDELSNDPWGGIDNG